ncbi:MAG: hypothetical protein ABIH82_00180 [Candidatus Woesearchaeota archaeon]
MKFKMLNKFNFNKKEGYLGLISLSFAITLFCFSIIYFMEAFSWMQENSNIAGNWFTGAGIMLIIGFILIITAGIWLKKAKEPQTKKSLDFNKLKGLLGICAIPVGLIFILQGIIYRIEGAKWFWSGVNTATEWHLAEASAWFTSSMYMFIIGAILVCGGALLLVLEYRKPNKNH